MIKLFERLNTLGEQKGEFVYDLRANCQVYNGIVAAYRTAVDSAPHTPLSVILLHALDNDSIVRGSRDARGALHFQSCRLFTDVRSALRFAQEQGSTSVLNLNRSEEVPVSELASAA